jgi:hypothetical protein
MQVQQKHGSLLQVDSDHLQLHGVRKLWVLNKHRASCCLHAQHEAYEVVAAGHMDAK